MLISDLADDPAGPPAPERGRGRRVRPRPDHRSRVVALNAAPDDEAFFSRLAGAEVAEASPAPARPLGPAGVPPSTLPGPARRRDRRDTARARGPLPLVGAAALGHAAAAGALRMRAVRARRARCCSWRVGGVLAALAARRAPVARRRCEAATGSSPGARRVRPGARAPCFPRASPATCSGSATPLRLPGGASRSFAAVQAAGRGYDNGLSESRTRGELEAELAALGAKPRPRDRVGGRQPARDPRLRRLEAVRPDRTGAGRPERGRLPGGDPPRSDERGREVQPRAAAARAARPRASGRDRTTAPAAWQGPPRCRRRPAGEGLLIAASLIFLTPRRALLALGGRRAARGPRASRRGASAGPGPSSASPRRGGAGVARRALAVTAVVGLLGLARAASPCSARPRRSACARTPRRFFVIDISRSMLASRSPDAPTRIARARARGDPAARAG